MARARTRRRGKSSPWKGSVGIVAVFVALIAVNAYAFIFQPGKSITHLLEVLRNNQVPTAVGTPNPGNGGTTPLAASGDKGGDPRARPGSLPAAARPLSAPAPLAIAAASAADYSDEGRVESGSFQTGDTLASVLRRAGVGSTTATEVLAALRPRLDPDKIVAGHEYTVAFDAEEHLRSVEVRTAPDRLYRVERMERGGDRGTFFRAAVQTGRQEVGMRSGGVTVGSSLYDAIARADEEPALAARIADALAGELDLLDDLAAGDRVRYVVERQLVGGKFQRYGRLRAVELTAGRGGPLRAYWFEPRPGLGDYFTADGQSLTRSLLPGPLRYLRVPEHFDRKRLHPAPRTEQGRAGLEWGAPTGTPVWATGEGRVAFRGKRAGDGECVVVAHPGGMETTYAHLARIAKGLELNQEVRQRQIIGYVGATGLVAGSPPRLHYAVRVGGHALDLSHPSVVRRAAVPERDLGRFRSAVAIADQHLDDAKVAAPVKPNRPAPKSPR